MNNLEQTITQHLQTYHRGKDNAITFKRLAAELDINDRELRSIVADLIKSGEAPVCTGSESGYYWPVCIEDIQHSNAEDMSRIYELFKRPKGRKRAWNKYQNQIIGYEEIKQLELV
jgi:formyltetrahydrofolate synthetase